MAVRIGHASIDENGRIRSGAAGDQTGRELCTRDWYAGNWTVLLRAKDSKIAEKIAKACEAACANNNIGYDQNQRNNLRTQAKAVKFDLSKIATKCECDCSSLVSVCVEAAGVGMSKAYTAGNAPTTRTLQSKLVATGKFEALTGKNYLGNSKNLKRGDILVKAGSHTVIVLSNGSGVQNTQQTSEGDKYDMKTITKGSRGKTVKIWQIIVDAKVDGKFGDDTLSKTIAFQEKHNLKPDGIVGPKTWAVGLKSV